MNAQSKTPRTDEIAQRHLAGCDIVTCYHYAIRLANDLETELAASRAREVQLREALERCHVALPDGDDTAWEFLVTLPPPPVVPLNVPKHPFAP